MADNKLKDAIKALGESASKSGADVKDLQKELRKLFEEFKNISSSEKETIAKLVKDYDKLKIALSKIISENGEFKDIAEDIFETVEDLVDEYDKLGTFADKLNKKIKEQLDYLNESKSLTEKITRAREKSKSVIESNKLLLKSTVDILESQLRDLNIAEALSELDGNTITDDLVRKLKEIQLESETLSEALKLRGAFEEATANSRELVNSIDKIKKRLESSNITQEESISLQEELNDLEREKDEILQEVNDRQEEYNQYLKDNSAQIKEDLKNQKETVTVLLGEKKIVSEINDIHRQYSRSIEDSLVTYASIANLIPGIGESLSNSFLEANRIAQDSMNAIRRTMIETRDPIAALQEGWNVLTNAIGRTNVILLGMALTIGLIAKGVYDLFNGILKTTSQIRTETKLSSDQAYELYKNALAVQTSFDNQISSLEEIISLQSSLVSTYGRYAELTSTTLTQISDAAKVLGYSAETAAKLQGTFMELGADESLAGNLQVVVGNLAKANKIAPGIIAEDLVNNSEFVATNFAGMPKEAAKAAIEARKLGYSLAQAAKIQEHLFDIQGSLTAQMEASVALGRVVNTTKARQLALDNDIGGMMREISKEAGTYAEFSRMSVPQRKLLAKAFGLEVSEIQKSLFIKEKLSDLSDKELGDAQKYLKDLENVESMTAGQLKAEISKAQQAEKFNVLMDKFKNTLIRLILPLAEALLPIFESLVSIAQVFLVPLKMLIPILKGIGFLAEAILLPFRWLSGMIDWILRGMQDIGEAISNAFSLPEGFSDGLKTFLGIIVGIPLAILGIGLAFGKVLPIAGSFFTSIGNGLRQMFNPDTYSNFFKGLKEYFKMGKGGMTEMIFGKEYKGGQFMPGGGRAKAGGERAGGLVNKFKNPFKKETVTEKIQEKTETVEDTSKKTSTVSYGKNIKIFLQNLSEGLKSMGQKGVFRGALNLIPASIGLLIMKPSLSALSNVSEGGNIKTFFENLSEGLKYMGQKGVLKGSLMLVVASIGLLALIPASLGLAALSAVAPMAQTALTILGTSLVSFGTLMSSGVALLGVAALIALAIGFGYALKLMSPAIEALGTVVSAVFDGLNQLLTTLLSITPSAAGGLLLLGVALGGFAISAVASAVLLTAAIPSLIIFGIAFSLLSKSMSKAVEPMEKLSNSVSNLVDGLLKLTEIPISTIKDNLKELSSISDIVGSEMEDLKTNATVVSEIQSNPINNQKSGEEAPKEKTFEERNAALGENSTVRMLTRLVQLMEQSTANPPNLVLEFDDGTVSKLKTRIKKTV